MVAMIGEMPMYILIINGDLLCGGLGGCSILHGLSPTFFRYLFAAEVLNMVQFFLFSLMRTW